MTSTPAPELLPCPACGVVPKLCEFKSYAFGMQWQIDCENPECCITISSMCRNTPEDAIAAWNTRAPARQPAQEIEGLQEAIQAATDAMSNYDGEGDCRINGFTLKKIIDAARAFDRRGESRE